MMNYGLYAFASTCSEPSRPAGFFSQTIFVTNGKMFTLLICFRCTPGFTVGPNGIENPLHRRKLTRIKAVLAAKGSHPSGGRLRSEHNGSSGDNGQIADSRAFREL
jgi:hypothetical protein